MPFFYKLILIIAFSSLSLSALAQKNNLDALINNYTSQKISSTSSSELISALEKNILADPAGATSRIDQLIGIAQRKNDNSTTVSLSRLKGASLFYQGKFVEAEKVTQKAYELARKHNIQSQMPRILATKGNAQIMQSKLPEALETQNQGLKIAESLKDEPTIHLIKNNLVAIYLQMNDFDLAKHHLEDNIRFYSKIPAMANVLATNYNNLALVYEKQKDYKKSNELLHKALAQNGVEANKTLLSQIYNNLGSGYNNLNENDSAFYYFSKAYEITTETKNTKSQAVSKIGLSDYYFKTKNYSEAEKLASEAYATGKEVKSIDVQKESADQLMKIYNYLYQPDAAQKYYQISKQLTDSISNQDNTRKLTRLQMQYDFDKKEEQYKHQQIIHNLNLQQQLLLNELNQNELAKTQQEQKLQSAELENQKLQNAENTQKLKITTQEKALAENRNKSLQQENELAKLKLKQYWLYGFIGILIVGLLFFLLWNKNRLKQLKTENKLKEKEAEELLQKNKVTESELKAIRSQMNPHFIFNVLNSIEAYIVESEPEMARSLVQKFAKLSRMILENSTQALSTLDSEWKVNKIYTDIEHIRFGKHFDYRFEVEKRLDLRQYLIPPMMLQPLIENAILHGLRYERESGASLLVTVTETDKHIEIKVIDNGSGLSNAKAETPGYKKKSFGVSSIKDRIEILNSDYPDIQASFEIIDRATLGEKGCVSLLRLPKIEERK